MYILLFNGPKRRQRAFTPGIIALDSRFVINVGSTTARLRQVALPSGASGVTLQWQRRDSFDGAPFSDWADVDGETGTSLYATELTASTDDELSVYEWRLQYTAFVIAFSNVISTTMRVPVLSQPSYYIPKTIYSGAGLVY